MCNGCFMGKPDPKLVAENEAAWDDDGVDNIEDCADETDDESCTDE